MKERLTRAEVSASKKFVFESFGVVIGIEAQRAAHLEAAFRQLEKIFPDGLEKSAAACEFRFVIKSRGRTGFELYRNGEKVIEYAHRDYFYDLLDSQVRLTVAEFARQRVFLHAGVVGWRGRALVIPARSFAGKTTLVAELVKKGAAYYSDEYAVLDADGNVQPFPKWLSMRSRAAPFAQIDLPVETFGGAAASETIPVGLVLLAVYDRQKPEPRRFEPRPMSQGQAILELLRHALPVRRDPPFVLEVLNKLTARAIIVEIRRGEAEAFAGTLLDYFENHTK